MTPGHTLTASHQDAYQLRQRKNTMMSAEIMTRERKQSDDLTEKHENELIDHAVLAMTAIAGLLTMIYLQEPSL